MRWVFQLVANFLPIYQGEGGVNIVEVLRPQTLITKFSCLADKRRKAMWAVNFLIRDRWSTLVQRPAVNFQMHDRWPTPVQKPAVKFLIRDR